jgi:hypothetical protein
MSDGSGHPVLATDKYLGERAAWSIHPCQKCGFADLFDAPSDLIRTLFPNVPADAVMEGFTTFCPLCGGVQSLEMVADNEAAAPAHSKNKPWWKFWQ